MNGLVRVQCIVCRVRRFYLPGDLVQLFGDRPFEEVGRRMRCERCKHGGEVDVGMLLPTAKEREAIRVRRLVEIRTVRRPVWRDE